MEWKFTFEIIDWILECITWLWILIRFKITVYILSRQMKAPIISKFE